jgi:hypothetical protein
MSVWGDAHARLARTHAPTRPLPLHDVAAARARALRAGGPGLVYAQLVSMRFVSRSNGVAPNTAAKYASELRFFGEFCAVAHVDPALFGAAGTLPADEEEAVLELFALYCAHFPRASGKKHNTGDYAGSCVHAVRDYASSVHARPVCTPIPRGLELTLRGLRKQFPCGQRAPRFPILQHHLRAVLRRLRRSDPRHRVLRAFYLCCWQLVCRSGDLIRGKKIKGAGSTWDPSRETHIGRVSVEMVRDGAGRAVAKRVSLRLKPGKTDPEGKHHFVKTCLVDEHEDSLSFGAALVDLIRGLVFPPGVDLAQVPLFLDPATGRELTYRDASCELREHLTACGFKELASGLHSLRIGGSTCAADEGGDLASAFCGKWAGSSRHKYQHALRDKIERDTYRMARAPGGVLAVRPGPVSSYAR